MFDPGRKDDVPAYGEAMASNIQFGWSALHALRTPRYKYIDAPRAELYDLVPGRRGAGEHPGPSLPTWPGG